ASERRELRIIADQYGAPTSARLIADVVATIIRSRLGDGIHDSGGLINVAASGETTWHGFATAIVAGLKLRGVRLAVDSVLPIITAEYPTKAKRPANSRLDLTRLQELFRVKTPNWDVALGPELDHLASQLTRSGVAA